MTTIAKVAGAIHGLSLAIAYGGPVFAKAGLKPALRKLASHEERHAVMQSAWDHFNKVDVAAHVGFTGSWLVLRTLLGRIYLTRQTKGLVMAKDVLVAGALITGVAATINGKALKHAFRGMSAKVTPHPKAGAATTEGAKKPRSEYHKLLRLEKALGRANMAFLAGAIIITPAIVVGVIRSQRMGLLARLFNR